MPETGEEPSGGGQSDEETPDRRESVRVQISSEVRMKAVTHLMTGAGTDVSVGGIYVVTSQDLPVGSLVDLEFTVDTVDRTFHVVGEVRWRQRQPVGEERRWGLGIEFLDLDTVERGILREFVERRDPVDPVDADGPSETIEKGDRRRAKRVPISTRVRLKTVANLTDAAGSDLSVGGMYLVTEERFAVDDLVELEFTVDGIAREFRVLGEVRRRQKLTIGEEIRWGLGVEFHELSAEERAALEEFVDRRTPLHPDEPFEAR